MYSVPFPPRSKISKEVPHIYLKISRFEISVVEFNGKIKEISCELERVRDFSSSAHDMHEKIIDGKIKHKDIC